MSPLPDESWDEEELDVRAEPVDLELLARRRRFRSWVRGGMLGLAAFTAIGLLVHAIGPFGVRAAATAGPHVPLAVTPAPSTVSATSAQRSTVETPAPPAPQVNAAAARESLRDLELPPSVDASSLARWSSLARNATSEELADVDARLARLIKTPARERSMLVRAVLWRERGRDAAARRLFEDLARHAKSREVRAAARSNLPARPSAS